MKRVALPLLLIACSSDPGEWRPAKHAKEYPAAKDAYRVQSGDVESCEPIGVAHGQSVRDLAATAANHGGTHYVVRDERESVSYETHGTAAQPFGRGTPVMMHSTTTPVRHRHLWAQVYRCD